MNLNKLKLFLYKFDIESDIVNNFLRNKKIININENYFLVEKNLSIDKNCVFLDKLIFIKLKNLLPSNYLLNFIYQNSNNIVQIKSEKQALEFTYSKSLSLNSIINKNKLKFIENKFYLLEYIEKFGYKNNSINNLNYDDFFLPIIIGYFEYKSNISNISNNKNKFPLINTMNIGEFLHEN